MFTKLGAQLDYEAEPAVITFSSTSNRDLSFGNERYLSLRASLEGSTSETLYEIKVLVFPDCSEDADALATPFYTMQVLEHVINQDEYLETLAASKFTTVFDQEGTQCPISYRLIHNLEEQASGADSILSMSVTPVNDVVITFAPTSDSDVQTWDLMTQQTACSLGNVDITSCPVSFTLEVLSINGTVAMQAEQTLTVKSECYTIA